MSVQFNPSISVGGLVLHWDAANTKCYPRSGTTTTDMSTSALTGTLTNTPTFSSSNQGYFTFNGTTQYVSFGNNKIAEQQDKSCCAWIYRSASGIISIVDKEYDSGGGVYGGWGFWVYSTNKLALWVHASKDMIDTGTTIPLSTWVHVSFVYNSTTKSVIFYYNGVSNSTVTDATIVEQASDTTALTIGGFRGAASWNGHIASVIVYNRQLSAAEVLSNFNATRGRFGV